MPTLAGPAMGTTYRVTLAADISGMTRGEVHREVEAVLARIDRAASTWRNDSDASRFNGAAAGEWVMVSADLVTLVDTAREIHEQSEGAFDITVGPLVRLWSGRALEPSAIAIAEARGCVGMRLVESRPATTEAGAALRKSQAGVEIDLSGIAPGYAVDRIGERLLELGSAAHLVELGGEVRAWGQPSEGRPWRVRLRAADAGHGQPQEIFLADGMAVATSTCRPGRSPIDPRTGRPVASSSSDSSDRAATVRSATCAEADAWAVAAVVLGLQADADGTITVAPSTPAGPTAARRAVP
ncbi:MAG: FAD:protein FMN transferase [Planctomycetia bacterium]|nr:FAD:protein FMN transferase [Planctomycetia bacterium]